MDINALLSNEFSTDAAIISRIVSLIDEGNTIPFIARYRKEMTGAMDDQKAPRNQRSGWVICVGWINAASPDCGEHFRAGKTQRGD